MADYEVPILIVGGGASGLSSSIMLSDLGVDHILVERHPATSHAPKAHILNQRTMEIFRQMGIADDVLATGSSGEYLQHATWRTSLGGSDVGDAQAFAQIKAWGGGHLAEKVAETGPVPPCSCHQIKLEPLLHRVAAERSKRPLLFHTEVSELVQTDDGVLSTLTNRTTGEQTTVLSTYVIAADSGRTVGPKFGVELEGSKHLQDNVSMHFSADLSPYLDDGTILNWMLNLSSSDSFGLASGVLVPVERGRKSSQWVMHFAFPPDAVEVDAELLSNRARTLLKLPDLEIEVHQVNHWILESVLASNFQTGPFFFVGDAAHKHPPTIGIGMNSAYGDTSNLVWKLAMVVKGQAGPELLDTYEPERRPVIQRNIDCASTTYYSHMLVNVAMGLMPGMDSDARKAAFEAFFSDTPEGARKRERAQIMIEDLLRMEFQAMALELGYNYESSAVVTGSEPVRRQPDPTGCDYVPIPEPGHRLPHAWIKADGQDPVSTLDLTGAFERLVLITGADGSDWVAAAEAVSRDTGVEIAAVTIGGANGYADVDGTWAEVGGIGSNGALLVRPDNHIGWRSMESVGDAQSALLSAVNSMLSRKGK